MCLRDSTHFCILSFFFQLVQPDEEFSFQQFLNPANKYKNRYANIVACRLFLQSLFTILSCCCCCFCLCHKQKGQASYRLAIGTLKLYLSFVDDHTRVLLNPIDGVPGSDYINANFLDVSLEAQANVNARVCYINTMSLRF